MFVCAVSGRFFSCASTWLSEPKKCNARLKHESNTSICDVLLAHWILTNRVCMTLKRCFINIYTFGLPFCFRFGWILLLYHGNFNHIIDFHRIDARFIGISSCFGVVWFFCFIFLFLSLSLFILTSARLHWAFYHSWFHLFAVSFFRCHDLEIHAPCQMIYSLDGSFVLIFRKYMEFHAAASSSLLIYLFNSMPNFDIKNSCPN